MSSETAQVVPVSNTNEASGQITAEYLIFKTKNMFSSGAVSWL